MLKAIKKNKILIIGTIVTLLGCLFLIHDNRLDIGILVQEDRSIHLSLLTVNSIIGGFMFSGLSLIVSSSNTKVVEDMERANYMDEVYNSILLGMLFNILSIILSLMIFLKSFPIYTFNLVSWEVAFLVSSIYCFIVIAIKLFSILSLIRRSTRRIPKDVIKRALKDERK